MLVQALWSTRCAASAAQGSKYLAKCAPGHSPSDSNSGSDSSRGGRAERSGSCGSTSSGTASCMYSEALLTPVRYASRSCAAVHELQIQRLHGKCPTN